MDNRLQPPPCSVQTSNKASGSVYPQDGTEAENYQNYHIINYQIITIIKLPIVNYQNKMSNVGNGSVREAPLKKTQGLFGHCPNSNCTPLPPPFAQTVTLGHFIFGPT